jgi:LPXTG-motif cell wall-anchored protein
MNNTDSTGTATGTTGTMNNDTTTGTTTTGTTGSYSGSATDTTTTSSASLPQTASDMPTVAIAGLLALFAAFAIRTYAKRNA